MWADNTINTSSSRTSFVKSRVGLLMQPQDLFCNRSSSFSALWSIEAIVSEGDIFAHLTVKCGKWWLTKLSLLNPEGLTSELYYSVCFRGGINQVKGSQNFVAKDANTILIQSDLGFAGWCWVTHFSSQANKPSYLAARTGRCNLREVTSWQMCCVRVFRSFYWLKQNVGGNEACPHQWCSLFFFNDTPQFYCENQRVS